MLYVRLRPNPAVLNTTVTRALHNGVIFKLAFAEINIFLLLRLLQSDIIKCLNTEEKICFHSPKSIIQVPSASIDLNCRPGCHFDPVIDLR